jgi:hypothetical protein
VSIRVEEFPLAEADIDAMSLQSAIYNLLLNACQAATENVMTLQVAITHFRKSENRLRQGS